MKLSTYPQLLTKRKKEAKKEKLATTNNCQLFLGRHTKSRQGRYIYSKKVLSCKYLVQS